MGPIKNTPLIIFLKMFLLVICFTNIIFWFAVSGVQERTRRQSFEEWTGSILIIKLFLEWL